jgi:hypothetical protein
MTEKELEVTSICLDKSGNQQSADKALPTLHFPGAYLATPAIHQRVKSWLNGILF